jgi:hypothetical protein
MHEILESIVHDQGVIKDKLEDLAKHPSSVTLSPKKMTMNVFLDVACKDAMNFGDFVDRISVTMSDLAYSRDKTMGARERGVGRQRQEGR